MVVVKEMAQLIGVKPHMIIAELMELGSFVLLNDSISFALAAEVLTKYGVFAKKAA